MLFNSFEFILLFLPITLIGFFGLGALRRYRLAIAWLVVASLLFYGYWNPRYLYLILGSIGFNYVVGQALQSQGIVQRHENQKNEAANKAFNHREAYVHRTSDEQFADKTSGNAEPDTHESSVAQQLSGQSIGQRQLLLTLGIIVNLAALGYYKYANFFVENLNTITGLDLQLQPIVLPLAISFFTFQQVAYLVDTYQQKITRSNFLDYCLFVTFFPQLIAGPIVHHQDMMPQFRKPEIFRPDPNAITIGLTLLGMGLCKKVAIADTLAHYANPMFDAALTNQTLSFSEAWLGSLAYTFQLYFDFSGYADMSIGMARMLGLTLPLNFFSPYKSASIIEFWRRWHMTLSRFLRDYLYIPLGGNRRGVVRRYSNLMMTMLLGGLWHGAGWTFIVWGGLHGAYLVINHLWRGFLKRCQWDKPHGERPVWAAGGAIALTFLAVHVSWVFFRAESLNAARSMLTSMMGLNGVSLEVSRRLSVVFDDPFGINPMVMLALAAAIAFFSPNTYELMRHHRPALETYSVKAAIRTDTPCWQPTSRWAIATSLLIGITVIHLFQTSEFLYFDF